MNESTVDFGYNTDLGSNVSTSWQYMGSKFNFNISGKILGVFSDENHDYLISQVTKSYGDNCMVGTVDVREITTQSEENSTYVLVSNNEPSEECMTISRSLSTKEAMEELSKGTPLEFTKEFTTLVKTGINLENKNIQFDEKVIVCGVEKEVFEEYKNKRAVKSR